MYYGSKYLPDFFDLDMHYGDDYEDEKWFPNPNTPFRERTRPDNMREFIRIGGYAISDSDVHWGFEGVIVDIVYDSHGCPVLVELSDEDDNREKVEVSLLCQVMTPGEFEMAEMEMLRSLDDDDDYVPREPDEMDRLLEQAYSFDDPNECIAFCREHGIEIPSSGCW